MYTLLNLFIRTFNNLLSRSAYILFSLLNYREFIGFMCLQLRVSHLLLTCFLIEFKTNSLKRAELSLEKNILQFSKSKRFQIKLNLPRAKKSSNVYLRVCYVHHSKNTHKFHEHFRLYFSINPKMQEYLRCARQEFYLFVYAQFMNKILHRTVVTMNYRVRMIDSHWSYTGNVLCLVLSLRLHGFT